jgi:hypothetical protein
MMQVCKANSGSYVYLPLAMMCVARYVSVVGEAHPRYVFVHNQPCHDKCSNARAIVPIPGYSQVNERQSSKNAARNAQQTIHQSNPATKAVCQYQIYHRSILMHTATSDFTQKSASLQKLHLILPQISPVAQLFFLRFAWIAIVRQWARTDPFELH